MKEKNINTVVYMGRKNIIKEAKGKTGKQIKEWKRLEYKRSPTHTSE